MRILSFPSIVGVTVLLLASGPAAAQPYKATDPKPSIFTCVDEQGRRLTSDRPIDACANRPMRELRLDGAVKRDIPPPLTRAQREDLAERKAAERVEQMRKRQEQARDRALLAAYPSMDDLSAMRDRQLAELQVQIDRNYERMMSLHEDLQGAQAQANNHAAGRAPEMVKQRIARLASEILAEDALVKSRIREQEVIRSRFAEDADRLEYLLIKQAEANRRAT